MTRYVLLKGTNEPGTVFAVHAEVDANGTAEAIRKGAEEDGTYVAIPLRSWRPLRVTTQTKTSLRLDAV